MGAIWFKATLKFWEFRIFGRFPLSALIMIKPETLLFPRKSHKKCILMTTYRLKDHIVYFQEVTKEPDTTKFISLWTWYAKETLWFFPVQNPQSWLIHCYWPRYYAVLDPYERLFVCAYTGRPPKSVWNSSK